MSDEKETTEETVEEEIEEQKDEEQKDENPLESKHFVVATMASGKMLLGTVEKNYYAGWLNNRIKLILQQPKLLLTMPVYGKGAQAKEVVGFNLTVQPSSPIKSLQDLEGLDAERVEVLGDVETDEKGLYTFTGCEGSAEIFKVYGGMLREWAQELDGIIRPTLNDVATSNKAQQGGIIQFPGR